MKRSVLVLTILWGVLSHPAVGHFDHGVGGERLDGGVDVLSKPSRPGDRVLGFRRPQTLALESHGLVLESGLTLSAWVFPKPNGSRQPVLSQMAHTLGEGTFALFATSEPGAGFQLRLENGAVREVSGYDLPTERWFHYAATFDGDTARVYVDGVSVASVAVSGRIAPCNDPVHIGFAADTEEAFGGLVDDIGIWPRALSGPEIDLLTDGERVSGAFIWRDFESGPEIPTAEWRKGKAALFDWRPYLALDPPIPGRIDSALTVSAWVYNRGTTRLGGPIVGHWGEDVADRAFVLYSVGGDGFGFRAFWDDGTQNNLTVVETPSETWFHYAATYDGREMRVYVNGVPLGRAITVDKRFADGGASATWIGGLGVPGMYFNGYIDDVGIWDVALGTEQLMGLARGNAREIPDPVYENGFTDTDGADLVAVSIPVRDASVYELAAAGDLETLARRLSGSRDPATQNHAFWWASMHGRLSAVRYLVGEGADVNTKLGYGGFTALHAAVRDRRVETMQLLIELGADVNLKDDTFRSPAWGWAGHFGYAVLRSYLLEVASETDLYASIEADSPENAERLLAESDSWDLDSATRRAAALGRPEILELLIQAGANTERVDRQGRTPLDLAILNSNFECVDVLRRASGLPVDGADAFASKVAELDRWVGERDVEGAGAALASDPDLARTDPSENKTWLHRAADVGDAKLARLFIEAGAQIGRVRGDHSPVSWAATVGAGTVARELISAGASYDLFVAAGLGDLERVKSFFDGATLIEAASVSGSTRIDENREPLPKPPTDPRDQVSDALYLASRHGHRATVSFLIDRGCDPDFQAFRGGTPLYWATQEGHVDVVRVLLDSGADPLIPDRYGRNPMQMAARSENAKLRQLILNTK